MRSAPFISLRCWWVRLWLALSLTGVAVAFPFTYQGRLVENGVLANGPFELRFRLFDQLTDGTQVGGDLWFPAVTVTNGIFTTALDFGPGVFNGAPRWLEVGARAAGTADPLEVFDPRQAVTAVPYALYSLSGSGDASALTSGLLPDARLSSAIARSADVLSQSNALTAQFTAADTALLAQLQQLQTSLTSLSNQVQALQPGGAQPPGLTVASAQPDDAELLALGFVPFLNFPAPGWISGPDAGAPSARFGHSAVWTGDSLLVWGGTLGGGTPSGTGGRFDANLGTWSLISTLDPPSARRGHTAVWTGESMLVWGGFNATFLGDGARYDPEIPSWSPLGTTQAPEGRDGHVAVWTGDRMVIWGGRSAAGLLDDGALYNPANGQWSALPVTAHPQARLGAVAAWTGSALLVWGGLGESGELGSGALLPITAGVPAGAWTTMSTTDAPTPRTGPAAVWTGTRWIVWGGEQAGVPLGNGASFNPANNTWEPLPTFGAPSARSHSVAVWTGEEVLIVGGNGPGGALAGGAAFHPGTGQWRALPGTGSPLARTEATGVWTGTELLVFGGFNSGGPLAALQRLNPQPTWHLYRKP